MISYKYLLAFSDLYILGTKWIVTLLHTGLDAEVEALILILIWKVLTRKRVDTQKLLWDV